jgi:Fungalysin/Thermolysin Propeptide Motif
MLRSITVLLGLSALRAAAIQHNHAHSSGLQVDISKYRLQANADYVKAEDIPHSNSRIRAAVKFSDYVETATSFVKSMAPGATFRVVDGHYVGSDGIGHVYFKQILNGLEVDNGDFNVNVRPTQPSESTRHADISIRLLRMVRFSLTETPFTLEQLHPLMIWSKEIPRTLSRLSRQLLDSLACPLLLLVPQ